MRTSTLTRRLRVWEHFFNQTTQKTHKGTTFATMTKSDGVVSMWSKVEAAPKVRTRSFLYFISFVSSGVFGRQRPLRV